MSGSGVPQGEGAALCLKIEDKLKDHLQASFVKVEDLSDGCGSKIDVVVVSDIFEGVSLVDRQRKVHAAIDEEMKVIHAITMKCKTSQQWEKMQAK